MTDREKVTKGLRCCMNSTVEDPFHMCQECPYNEVSVAVQDCRALLSAEALELLNNQQEVIRCKDCMHYEDYRNKNRCMNRKCIFFGYPHNAEFYCAFGVRKR